MKARTKKVLTKKWEVLQEAKKYLAWNYTDEYRKKDTMICFAIKYAELDGSVDKSTAESLTKIIQERLGNCPGLYTWLEFSGLVSMEELKADQLNNFKKLQFTRHAWLDSMIAEFKALDE